MPVSPKKGKIAKEGPLNPVGLFIVRQAWRVARKRHMFNCGG
jgi:hypothetical protein